MHKDTDDRPPFFASWKRLYIVLILGQILLLVLFYLFTVAFQ